MAGRHPGPPDALALRQHAGNHPDRRRHLLAVHPARVQFIEGDLRIENASAASSGAVRSNSQRTGGARAASGSAAMTGGVVMIVVLS
jgi:hypothetical protein